jgi:hypothetical protein
VNGGTDEMTVKECAEAYNFKFSTIHEWIRKGWIKAVKDEHGTYHIDEKTLPCIMVKDTRGYEASFRVIHLMQDIYEYVLDKENSIDERSELIKSLCSRGCEHIHRLRDCNYD